MTDQVNSFGEPLDQDEYADPGTNESAPDPLLGETPRSGALASIGSQNDKGSRVSAGREAMQSLRQQYSGAAGAANEAYAQQRKALQDATQRLLSMQFGPTDKEAAYRVAAAAGTGDTAGRYNPAGVSTAQADILAQQREGELQKQNLLTQYGMQIPQATLGAANARMNQITQQQRIQQSENNNAESKAAAPQKLYDKYFTPDPNNPGQLIDHPEMRAADVAQAAQVAQNSAKAKMALQQWTASGMVTPEMIDLAESDMKSLPSAILRNPIAMSQITAKIHENAVASGDAGKSFWAEQQFNKEAAKVNDDYTTKATHKELAATNTSIAHINVLKPLVPALETGNNNWLNQLKLGWDQKVMGKPAPTDFNGVKDFVTGEISKAVLPNGGGEAERQALAASAAAANSAPALNSIIQKWQDLLAGKLHFTKFNWDQSTKGKFGTFEDRFLLPETATALGFKKTPPARPGQTAATSPLVKYYMDVANAKAQGLPAPAKPAGVP